MGLSGVELKLGARCLYQQILDQALKILFLGAQKLTQSLSTLPASYRPHAGYYTTPSLCCNSNEHKMPGQIKIRWSSLSLSRHAAGGAAAPPPPASLQVGLQAGRSRQGHHLTCSDFFGTGTCHDQGQPLYTSSRLGRTTAPQRVEHSHHR